MHKLLSLVLSVSILTSSVAPALGQGGPITRGIAQGSRRQIVTLAEYQARSAQLSSQLARSIAQQTTLSANNVLQSQILSGNVKGLASQILQKPILLRAPILRNEFVALSLVPGAVTPAQRAQALKTYQTELKNTKKALAVSQTDLTSFLTYAKKHPLQQQVMAVRNLLADASSIGLLGSQKQAPILLDFYEQAKGSLFEDPAALITARGLLWMRAYDELGAFLEKNGQNPVLSGVKEYVQKYDLPVKFASVQESLSPAVNVNLAFFLNQGFMMPNRLHADASLQATEKWMSIKQDVMSVLKQNSVAPQAKQERVIPLIRRNEPQTTSTAIAKEESTLPEEFSIVPLMPGGFVQPTYVASVEKPVASTLTKEVSAPAAQPASSSSGIVYSGVPVFALANAFKQVAGWAKNFLKKGKQYDRSTFPVNVQSASGEIQETPLTFSIGESLSAAEYDRVVFREDPRFAKGYIVELHDHGKDPIRMDHFYMGLYSQDVGRLVKAAQQTDVELRLKLEHAADVSHETISKPVYSELTGEVLPLTVTVQLERPLWSRELRMAFSHWLEALGLPGTYSPSVLADAKLVLRENGELWMEPQGSTTLVPLPKKYYVRLPKNQTSNLVKMIPQLGNEPLNVVLSPTANRVNIVARDASLTNVSLGKTMGSIVNGSLGIAESNAKSLMFSINYVLPGFASLLTPILKKYGEKKLLALSLGMSVASGVLATLGGFYGFVEHMTLGPVQKGLFVSAMLLMSGASILKQLVSNMLIRANRGEVVLSNTAKQTAKVVEAPVQEQAHGFALIAKRAKEFFTNKSEQSLRDIALYNLSFVYKNIGTLAFLSAPFVIEHGVKALTGVSLGIDYSASFPLYAAYSTYVMWKILRSKLRDAYTAKTLIQSQQMVTNMLKTGGEILAAGPVTNAIIDDVARSFKDSLDALAFAHIKLDPSKEKKQLYKSTKELVLAQLEQNLVNQHHMSAPQAKELVEKVATSIKRQENNLGNMWKMMKAPGVPALTSAMTLATVHEFVISSSFSGTMKALISEGELANFLIAASLYVPFIIGRLGGNWISRRISKDSMYLFCSALSAVGTGIMATAGSSVSQTIAGAAIASLGVGNFFTQMYDYIMTKYPKQNRELSSILALTMGLGGLGAIPAGYFATQAGLGMPLDLLYAGGMLGVSLLLTPGMLKNSSIIKGLWEGVRAPVQKLINRIQNAFHRGGDEPPLVQNTAN